VPPASRESRKLRVLVVDDDPIYRETARMFLMMQGRDVTLAENGSAGLRVLAEAAFDILIVDLEMPDMTGLEVIARARSRPETADLPIIMVTSRDDAMAIDRAYELGASSFVVKPVNWTLVDHYLRFVCRAARNEAVAREAQKQAELLGQTKDNLMKMLRHEMKTPLNAIIGFTRLAVEARESGDLVAMRTHLDAVQQSGETLLGSLADMATYSDILSGRLQPARETLTASWLFDDMAELHAQALAGAGIALRRSEKAGDVGFTGDPALLTSAFSRLVENVIKHARGAKTIVLSVAQEDEFIRMAVEDDGEGMPADEITRCLEPFARADISLARTHQGLGMGLPIASGIAALHAGELIAESVPGSGFRVSMRLPIKR
jgi:two-component system, sensor histidine kinase and response regulator